MTDNLPEFLTREEVADHLRVPLSSVIAWIRAGHLMTYRVGRYTRISKQELNKFLENRQNTN